MDRIHPRRRSPRHRGPLHDRHGEMGRRPLPRTRLPSQSRPGPRSLQRCPPRRKLRNIELVPISQPLVFPECGAGAPARGGFRSSMQLESEIHRLLRFLCSFVTDTATAECLRFWLWRAGRPPHVLTFTHMSSAVLAKYRYRRRLPHLQRADCDLFVTFRTAQVILTPGARDLVLRHCLREGGIWDGDNFAGGGARATFQPRFRLYAMVVMPDHVHILFSPLRARGGWPFPLVDILQCMKGATAHHINKLLRTSGPVWQEESFDHVLRSDESLKEKCEYIRQNPVRRELVRKPEEYPWLWVHPDLCGAAAAGREG